MSDVLTILGSGGPLADNVADAICDAVRKAGALGEIPEKAVRGADGQQKLVRIPDPEWFDRIVVAAKAGVFERREVGAVVDHILATPRPDKGAA